MRTLILGLACLVGALACGAEGDAPSPTNAPPVAQCPTLPELAPNTLALVRGDGLVAVRALLETQLTDDQLTAVLDGLLRVIRRLDRAELEALLALADAPLLLDALPLVRDLLAFLAGDPAQPETFRQDVAVELGRLISTCDGAPLFGALDAALASPALPDLLGSLADALRLEIVQQVLDASQGGALARAGFTALVRNISLALVQPGFSVGESVTAPLARLDVLPLDTPPLSTLLASLDVLLDPSQPVLPALQDLVCCDLYGVGGCAAVTPQTTPLGGDPVLVWLLYDLFVSQAVPFDDLLEIVGQLRADPAVWAALRPLGAVFRELAADADLRRALEGLLVALLQPETVRRVLPELVGALDAGVVPELLALVGAVVDGCEPK